MGDERIPDSSKVPSRRPGRVEPTDEELIAAIGDGDMLALRTLYDRNVGWLHVRLRARCGEEDLVAEAVEETFLAVWRGASEFQGQGAGAAWIWGIGVRQLATQMRRAGRQRRPDPFPAVTAVRSTEEQVLDQVAFGDIGAALAQLSPELIQVVQLMIFDGLTAKEAGQILGVPAGTVKGRIRKAKSELRVELGRSRVKEAWT